MTAVTLRPLRAGEVAGFMAQGQALYTADLVANYRLSPARAAAEVAAQAGAADPDPQQDTMLAILSADQAVLGYIGLRENLQTASAFLTDFDILPQHQGQGFGTQAMAELAVYLAGRGVTQLRLRVAADNPRAKALYERLGFFATGTNMALDM